MAIYHLSATPVQRSKGHSATAASAYRAGENIRDDRTGLIYDYTRKRGVVESKIIAPENAPQWVYNRELLWNAAERAERQYNGRPAREIRLGLPHELTDDQRADLVFNYVRDMFVSEGMIADISIHRPDRHGDQRNHHAHILLTMRELDGDQFSTRKNTAWNKRETLENWREQWANYQNDALEDAGSSARVDHRSYADRGIIQEPTHHLGKEASAMERDGKQTRIGDENREIAEHNAHIKAYYEAAAQLESEIEREIWREQPYIQAIEGNFTPPERGASIEELISSFTGERPSEAVRLAMSGKAAGAQTPASMEAIVQSYGNEPDLTVTEEYERNNRAWYENLYYNTVETVQKYYTGFVDRLNAERSRKAERKQDEPEPERW